ncbi:hypothetical protein BGZ73_006519 [Actinomortierella ambigua]|nr:hypothetical protein BGZ73_006519 [Actinomortierella ambigua]
MSFTVARLSAAYRHGLARVGCSSSAGSSSSSSGPSTLAMVATDRRLFSTSTVSCLRSRPTLTKSPPRIKTLAQKQPKQQVLSPTTPHSSSTLAPPSVSTPHTTTATGAHGLPQPGAPQQPSQQVVINQALYTQQTHQQSFQLHHHHQSTSTRVQHQHHNHHHHNNNSTALYSEPYLRPPRRRSTFFSSRAHKDFARYVALLKSQAKHRYAQHHHHHAHHRSKGHHHHHHDRHHHRSRIDGHYDPYLHPWHYWYTASHHRRRPFKALAIGTVIGISGYTLYNDNKVHDTFAQLQSLFNQGYQAALHLKAAVETAGSSGNSGLPTSSLTSSSLKSSSTCTTPSSEKSPFFTASSTAPQSSSYQKQQIKMLTSEQITELLTRNQKSYKTADKEEVGKRGRVVGYTINQVASNNPIEDDLSKHVVRGRDRSEDQYFFGIFDGHGGWCCSHRVAQELAPHVAAELSLVADRSQSSAVVEAIERAFMHLDDKIVYQSVFDMVVDSEGNMRPPSKALATTMLLPAVSGSCALLAYIDARTNDLYVACTGDSRAVLGVKEKKSDGTHVWKAVTMSYDQTGRTKSEVVRMREEHPGEEDTVIMRGRVLGGLEPTRSFGDARYKWSREAQDKIFMLHPAYRTPSAYLKTPPYVTAKPVVKHHKLRPEDSFLVMATDGLWDMLTTDEVVQLVGDLLDGKKDVEEKFLDRSKTGSEQTGQQEQELTPTNLKPKGPVSQMRQFTFRDHTNASTHLIRNALGGADEDKLGATMAVPPPMSRVYRDDMTVTVVFFSEQDSKETLAEALEIDGLVEI